MPGYGNFAEGLVDGYLKGQGLKRQDKLDAQAEEDRAYTLQKRQRDDQVAAEDRQYTLEQRDVAKQEQQRKLKEQAFADAHQQIGREMAPYIVAGDPVSALNIAEKAFNEHPEFNDHSITKFERDANGGLILDKDGKAKMSVIDTRDNSVMASGAVDPKEYVAFFMSMPNPWKAVEGKMASDSKEADRVQGINDFKTKTRFETDEAIRRGKALGTGGQTPKDIVLFNFWKSQYPDKSTDEIREIVRTKPAPSLQEIKAKLAPILMKNDMTGQLTLEEAGRQVEEAFGNTAAGGSVDDVANQFGF